MSIAIPALSDFGDDRGPILVDVDTKSTLNKPVIYSNYIPSGVSRLNYVVVQTAVNVVDPNGLGVCQPLQALSASLKITGVNNSSSLTQQLTKTEIASVLGLFSAQIVDDTNITIPAPEAPI